MHACMRAFLPFCVGKGSCNNRPSHCKRLLANGFWLRANTCHMDMRYWAWPDPERAGARPGLACCHGWCMSLFPGQSPSRPAPSIIFTSVMDVLLMCREKKRVRMFVGGGDTTGDSTRRDATWAWVKCHSHCRLVSKHWQRRRAMRTKRGLV